MEKADFLKLMQVKSIASLEVIKLKVWLEAKVKLTTDEDWRAHCLFALKQIGSFQEDPEEFKAENLLAPPPGAPIGEIGRASCRERV